MDISNIKISTNSYAIKDPTARAEATNANKKIDGAKIKGSYTDSTETLEVLIEVGSIS